MPQVIQTFGLAPLEIGFLTVVPYLFASIGMISWGWHSDLTGERIWHVALPLFLAGAAFAWSATGAPLAVTMLTLTLATVGIYAAVSTFWSLPTAILTGTGAAAGLALVNSVGNLGGARWAVDRRRDQTGDRQLHRSFAVSRWRDGARRRDRPAVRPDRACRRGPVARNSPRRRVTTVLWIRRRGRELACAFRPWRPVCPWLPACLPQRLAEARP
jgi:hypothetical protein